MESNWATEHLQVIRTLMERSAIYRRALGPMMIWLGVLGSVAAAVGWGKKIDSGWGFGVFWMSVSLIGVSGAYVMVRRQALKDGEIFWSSPTRRVTQALLPPLVVGLAVTVFAVLGNAGQGSLIPWLPPIWMALYGCALHAAGFFMPRGAKLFGWIFIVIGALVAGALMILGEEPSLREGHAIMGWCFGGLHLGYGTYLNFTESRENET